MDLGRLKTLAVGALLATFVAGCSASQDETDPDMGVGAGESDVFAEDGIAPGGSLDRFQRGQDVGGEFGGGSGGGGPLRDVYYAYDSFDLSEEARDALRSNAEWLRENAGAKAEIEGHCDDRGTDEYNLALGGKRAGSARDYLVALGISPSRLTTISYGEELPACYEPTEACWSKNRRVHFVVRGE